MRIETVLLLAFIGTAAADFYFPRGCGRPKVSGGFVYPKKTMYGRDSKVKFYCNRGYKLDKLDIRFSQCKRYLFRYYWSPSNTCSRIWCAVPEAPVHGSVSIKGSSVKPGSKVYYGTYIQYKCNPGYELDGVSHSKCYSTSCKFKDPVPTCRRVVCDNPGAPVNGRIEPDLMKIFYSKSFTFTCEEGYKLVGASKATCQGDGTLDNDVPTCMEITCDVTKPVKFGSVEPSSKTVTYGEKVSWSCIRNFRLKGAQYARCLSDGTLSESTPSCEEIPVCQPPKHGDFVSYKPLKRNYQIHEKVTYYCEEGELVGDKVIRCLSSTEWSSEGTDCKFEK